MPFNLVSFVFILSLSWSNLIFHTPLWVIFSISTLISHSNYHPSVNNTKHKKLSNEFDLAPFLGFFFFSLLHKAQIGVGIWSTHNKTSVNEFWFLHLYFGIKIKLVIQWFFNTCNGSVRCSFRHSLIKCFYCKILTFMVGTIFWIWTIDLV